MDMAQNLVHFEMEQNTIIHCGLSATVLLQFVSCLCHISADDPVPAISDSCLHSVLSGGSYTRI